MAFSNDVNQYVCLVSLPGQQYVLSVFILYLYLSTHLQKKKKCFTHCLRSSWLPEQGRCFSTGIPRTYKYLKLAMRLGLAESGGHKRRWTRQNHDCVIRNWWVLWLLAMQDWEVLQQTER